MWSCLPLLALLPGAGPLAAQEPPRLLDARQISVIQAQKASRLAQAREHLLGRRAALGLDGGHTFQLRGSHVDALGRTHGRFDQYYRGVRVWGAEATTHTAADGTFLKPTAHLLEGPALDTTPSLAPAEALARVQQAMGANGAFASRPRVELVVVPETADYTYRIITHPGEPLNAYDIQKKRLRSHLAYHVHVALTNTQDGAVQRDFLIDAHDGSVLRTWNALVTAAPAATGTGRSQYSGTVMLTVTNLAGAYELRDKGRGKLPHPFTGELGNLVYAGDKYTGVPGDWGVNFYQDPDNVWGDGTNYNWSNGQLTTNGQTAAVDAAYGVQVAWDMFRNVFGRDGIDDRGTSTYSLVHYNNSGSMVPNANMNNCYWDDACFCMSFMDGYVDNKNSFSMSLTCPDVVGHELAHGVCAHTSGFIYGGESGGLNEANSDIFGTMTEFYVRGGASDLQASTLPNVGGNWTMGEQHDTRGLPFRWMYRPSKDGNSPDVWSADLKNMEVHRSSGPMNRAFALLSHGTGAGDWASAPTVAGLGNDKAARIWYHALAAYMYPSSDYANARRSTLRAALDLFPTETATLQAVRDAFAAINVGDAAGTGDDLAGPALSLTGGGGSGPLAFTATAEDDQGIAKVDFVLDGLKVGTLKAPPFTYTLDSTRTANGPHSLLAAAYDASGNRTVSNSVTFTVDNPNQQLLLDPGFDLGSLVWMENGAYILPGGGTIPPPHGGTGLVRFIVGRSSDRSSYARVSQPVTLPATGQNLQLSAWLMIENQLDTSTAKVTLSVKVWDMMGNPLATLRTLSNMDAAAYLTWAPLTVDLSAYRGQTLRVGFEANLPVDGTAFFLDDAALTVTGTAAAPGPTILDEPRSKVVAVATDALFSVRATASAGTLGYQWQASPDGAAWTNLATGTDSTYTKTSVTFADRGTRFRVLVSDASGTTTSLPAQLKVGPASLDLWPDGREGDVLDLAMLAQAMGRKSSDPDWLSKFSAADLNFDGQVDESDLAIFLASF